MSFGQITPIILLGLPVFAAAEIYYGNDTLLQEEMN
jgi:hypothetical protein